MLHSRSCQVPLLAQAVLLLAQDRVVRLLALAAAVLPLAFGRAVRPLVSALSALVFEQAVPFPASAAAVPRLPPIAAF